MKMLILIIVIFSFGWIPFGNVFFLFIESSLNIYSIYVSCRFIPPVLSICLNPIIIFSFSTNYQQALRNCLHVFSNANKWFDTDRTDGPEVELDVELPEIQGR